ncbi:hypothetical protein D9758_010114 [Tetrapyrgos nigripes]|uniref:Carboxylic ester hydrolase n=1 Tax=Tetrapyrgos nigripes TaxID=182062 RepID=A0A8H5CTU4_9AGAR|nr:hypothetical protein D9758_010114 [Tetrapyrgos nigripes]
MSFPLGSLSLLKLVSTFFIFLSFSLLPSAFASPIPNPIVFDIKHNITYLGITSSPGVEKFLNIPYGLSTAGSRRFASPEPAYLPSGTIYNATVPGPVCPQTTVPGFPWFSNLTEGDLSEDCLRLKVARPVGTKEEDELPVFVWVYGGGLFNGHINGRTNEPDALILESVANGLPVIFVAMNYRLNIFGFALSEALRETNDLNVGLKDQRLVLEWVKENIGSFGGSPDKVTIFGQSSGALSVTLQILAYGRTKGAPFHSAIMESVRDRAMARVRKEARTRPSTLGGNYGVDSATEQVAKYNV